MTKGKFYAILFTISATAFLAWALFRGYEGIKFNTEVVEECLNNYAKAKTAKEAKENLDKVIIILEEKGLTQGQTTIFFKTTDDDIGIWYEKLVRCRKDLAIVEAQVAENPEMADVLEMQVNGMRRMETSADASIAVPQGISIYPKNKICFWWGLISGIATIGFLIKGACVIDNDETDELMFSKR